jgi:hypothetical protein
MTEPATWAQEQFGSIDLGDARRTVRLVRIATSAAQSPAGTVTGVFTDDAERQGAYDFLESEHIAADALERGAGEAVAARWAQEKRLFVAVDGSSLTFVDRTGERGLGAVGTYTAGAVGLKVISALVLQGHARPSKLRVEVDRIGSRTLCGQRNRPTIQPLLERCVVESFDHLPRQACRRRAPPHLRHHAQAHAKAPCRFPNRQPQLPPQPQDLSNLPHRHALRRHPAASFGGRWVSKLTTRGAAYAAACSRCPISAFTTPVRVFTMADPSVHDGPISASQRRRAEFVFRPALRRSS